MRKRLVPALEAAGSSLDAVLKAQVYLSHAEDLPFFWQSWAEAFGKRVPPTTVVPVRHPAFGTREATIEVRRPASLRLALWSHPLLGAAEQRAEGASAVSVWRIKDQPPRRMEDGVPRVEMGVGVSLGTQTWDHVAAALDENVRALEDRDPYMTRWAREAAGADRTPSPALVERVVAAAGKAVKVAGGAELSDMAALLGGGPQRTTARAMRLPEARMTVSWKARSCSW